MLCTLAECMEALSNVCRTLFGVRLHTVAVAPGDGCTAISCNCIVHQLVCSDCASHMGCNADRGGVGRRGAKAGPAGR